MDKSSLEIIAVEDISELAYEQDGQPWSTKEDLRTLTTTDEDVAFGSKESDDVQAYKDMGRATWGGKFEFILTCVGYAVGLGNVWRFPYLCYKNGGGAFLIPYVVMLAIVGIPLFFLELAFGQFASLGPITIWRINPLLKGLGYGMVITSWLIGLYYNVIISYCVYFLYSSLTSELPWTGCDNLWNTNHCITPDNASTVIANFSMHNITVGGTVIQNSIPNILAKTSTAAEEYYRNHVLQQTASIDEFGTVNVKLGLCLAISWIVVGVCLVKGVQSLGKVVYFTATFPYLMLTILLVRGLTLDGALIGIEYYLKPDFSKLMEPRVWSDAATQIFYSLSACTGGLVAISSFNKFSNNCYRDALIVSILNCSTSIYAGLVIFSILGFMAHEKGVSVSEVAKHGPGLAFEVYPEALTQMPLPPLWASFFFIMMITLGFGSQFSIIECVMSGLIDEFRPLMGSKRNVIYFRIAVVFVSFLLGLPMICGGGLYLLNIVDFSVGGFPLLVIGLAELVAVNWIYGFENFWSDIVMMIGERPKIYWKACWLFLSPLAISVTILFNIIYYTNPMQDEDLPYPGWALFMGWMIALFPIAVIPGWFLYKYCREGGWQLLKFRSAPLPSWGPALTDNRKDRYSVNISDIMSKRERMGGVQPLTLRNTKDLMTLLRPGEFQSLMSGSDSSVNTGSSMTVATNVGSPFNSKTSF